MKTCFKCGQQKERSEFYAHPAMADGLLGKCKECTKSDVKTRRLVAGEKISAYEKKRFGTSKRRKQMIQCQRRRRVAHPEKAKAWSAVYWAIKTGKLTRKPCEICGEPKSQAHHGDYSKPLDVRWFCFKHHREVGHGQKVIAISA
jgi:hypothetical protein